MRVKPSFILSPHRRDDDGHAPCLRGVSGPHTSAGLPEPPLGAALWTDKLARDRARRAGRTYATKRKRQAGVYVFSVFSHTDKATANPLSVDQRAFYVLSTERLNTAVGEQARITSGSLLKHHPAKCSFAQLREHIEAAASQR